VLTRLIREPLLQFLLLGAALFALFGHGVIDVGQEDRKIVVSAADIDRLAAAFTRTWNRPPDPDERQAQVQDFIREEVLYRTALRIGLDKDDTIIRRRLRQKLEFLFEDTVPPPLEADLLAYFRAHPEKFRAEAIVSFRQIFVSKRRARTAEAEAARILAHLQSGEPGAEDEGDPFVLGEGFSRTSVDRVSAQFGPAFAAALAHASPERWIGPIESAYGWHLVLVTEYAPATLAPFAQVRAAVEREWLAEHRATALTEQYKTLLSQYNIVVDQRPGAP
jgi:hypothetical protein